ncbi:MAG: hypothetical protein GC152_03450 [Alphaproteobacteria bacterium]|nr:hypothetical protein [Alphaproteobacteria bacterium]
MSLQLLTPPAAEPVSVAELKAHLRVDGPDEDALVAGLGVAARQAIEARFGVAMLAQGWRLSLDAPVSSLIELPIGPVSAIGPVVRQTAAGEETIDTDDYNVRLGDAARVAFRAALTPARRFGAVAIDFTAGYANADATPAPMKLAVKALAAHYYEFREAAGVDRFHTSPESLNALMAPWRRLRT